MELGGGDGGEWRCYEDYMSRLLFGVVLTRNVFACVRKWAVCKVWIDSFSWKVMLMFK